MPSNPLSINTNLPSLRAQLNANQTNNNLSRTFEQLSSGSRINSDRDNPAGLAIAIEFANQLDGLSQGARNANDAISLAQVAEGGLSEATDILGRIREIAIQAANGINSSSDRGALQSEVNQLQQELNRITSNTEFNGVDVLAGDVSLNFQVGGDISQTVSINIDSALDNIGGLDVSTEAGAQAAISSVDAAINSIANTRADLGAVQSRFESTINNLRTTSENLASARSRIADTDFAQAASELAKNQILSQVNVAVVAQANASQQTVTALLS